MFEDKKRDELEALMAAWVGEVGQLNKAVQELPGVFQKSLASIESEFNAVSGRIGHAFDSYDVRSDKLYQQLLDANAQIESATEAIEGAAGHGVQQLKGDMDTVTQKTGLVLSAMVGLRDAVDGENGMSQKLQGVQNQFGEKLWILDKSISALSNLQISKLAQHQKAISAIQNIATFLIAFGLGYAFKALV